MKKQNRSVERASWRAPARRPAAKARIVYLALALAIAVAVGVAPWAIAHDEHEALPSKGAAVYKNMLLLTPQAEKSIGLNKTKIELANWREEIIVNCSVDVPCTRHAFAASLVSGKVEELLVRPGDEVRQGQVLARVKSLELEALELQLLQASAEHDLAARLLDRNETLAAGGAVAKRDLMISRATHREKSAELALLMAKLRAVGLSKDDLANVILTKEPIRSLPITSPMDGAISLADVRVGQTVEPHDHVFHLVDRSALAIVGEVLESDVWRVREGLHVRVVLASFPKSPLVGQIEHVGLKLIEQERTMHVRVEMPNPDGRIRPGMFGRMHITVAEKPETIVCPADAIIRHGAGRYVLREQGRNHGKYVLTRVTLGNRDDGHFEVLGGLYPGQRVVSLGTLELTGLLNDAFAVADARAASRPKMPEKGVTASVSAEETNRQIIVVPGRIESPTSRKHYAASTVEGRLASILVERGTRVRRGDVLAEIDSLQLRNRQLDLLSALVRLDATRQMLDRLKSLADVLVDRPRLWGLESEERSLENKVATISSQLELMGLEPAQIDRLKEVDVSKADIYNEITTLLPLRAPADGWVVEFELGVGEVVLPMERLIELGDLSRMWVQAYVREVDAGRVAVGQPVTVAVAGDPNFRARGTVTRTSPEISPTERVLAVWAELDNPKLCLREGMLATVEIEVNDKGQWPVALE